MQTQSGFLTSFWLDAILDHGIYGSDRNQRSGGCKGKYAPEYPLHYECIFIGRLNWRLEPGWWKPTRLSNTFLHLTVVRIWVNLRRMTLRVSCCLQVQMKTFWYSLIWWVAGWSTCELNWMKGHNEWNQTQFCCVIQRIHHQNSREILSRENSSG